MLLTYLLTCYLLSDRTDYRDAIASKNDRIVSYCKILCGNNTIGELNKKFSEEMNIELSLIIFLL